MQKIFFLDGEVITKTELIHKAEKASLKTKSKNKKRLREGLIFRPVKGYRSWGDFVGGCEQIGSRAASNIDIRKMIDKKLESKGIDYPCIAVFRMGNHSFVYAERGNPVIYNARLLVERGGTWYKEEDRDGNIIDWYLEDRDPDRTVEGEYLLTEKSISPTK